jgi:tetratricopeptide (TPR) repeat protein
MEENQLLDIANNSKLLKQLFPWSWGLVLLTCLGFLLLLSLCGCHLPKISVLEDPLTPEEHLNLGVAYERSGELDNAIKEYQKASRSLPDAYLYLGNAYFQKNELKQAEAFYKKAIEYNEHNADAYNNLAWLYYVKREKLEEAEHLALKAIELNPRREDIYRDTLYKIRKAKDL